MADKKNDYYVPVKKKKINGVRLEVAAFMAILIVVLIAVIIGMAVYNSKNKSSASSSVSNDDGTASVSLADDKGEIKTHKLCDDLKAVVDNVNAYSDASNKCEGGEVFAASVINIDGLEYLKISSNTISVYYQNQFFDDENVSSFHKKEGMVIISNGSRSVSYEREYDLLGNVAALLPVEIKTSDDSSDYIVFFHTAEDGMVSDIWAVDEERLNDYESVSVEDTLSALFTSKIVLKDPPQTSTAQATTTQATTSKETGNAAETATDITAENTPISNTTTANTTAESTEASGSSNILEVTFNGSKTAVYPYFTNSETSGTGAEKLSFNKEQVITYESNAVNIRCEVTNSEGKYLGKLGLDIVRSESGLVVKNATYASYAPANEEDYGTVAVIEPFEAPLYDEKYLTIYGIGNRRYLIEKDESINKTKISSSDLQKGDDGYKRYVGSDSSIKSHVGIDVSKFQGNIEWDKVKGDGVEFAIVRLGYRGYSEGNVYIDPFYKNAMEGAAKAGVDTGIYFFSQAINVEEAIEEAELCIKELAPYKVKYPVIIDVEFIANDDGRANKLTRQDRTDIVKAFCEKVKEAGYVPGFYANTKWSVMGLDLAQLQEYDFWFANYNDTFSYPYEYEMFQYSESGSVAGIVGNVDLNICFKDY
ncbi:MAG: glycoside hydrolase family 25 protein [Lachnospiraceae bacterium]|nr:glycoside hydrolase family 25 protein [Lachnospiraceae bacterium]